MIVLICQNKKVNDTNHVALLKVKRIKEKEGRES